MNWATRQSDAKRALRAHFAMLRRALDAASRAAAEDAALAALRPLLKRLPEAGTVAAYWAVGDEFPTARAIALCQSLGLGVALPRWTPLRRAYVWALHQGADHLRPGPHGIPEPAGSAPEVPAGEIDLFLAPGLAFDTAGGRIGYGGGWFDRLMAGARPGALVRGLCFPCQISASPLPREAHDIPAPPLTPHNCNDE